MEALVSAWDKEALLPLADALNQKGVRLWASAGTADFLICHGMPCESLEQITGFSELLDGKVKTLHPEIFAGILAAQPRWHIVAVDLYPFPDQKDELSDAERLLLIDVGGVSLLRAAAKNHPHVWVIPGKENFSAAIETWKTGFPDFQTRKTWATMTFAYTARYDLRIFSSLAGIENAFPTLWPVEALPYGENPHQKSYRVGTPSFFLRQGPPLSYNNHLDLLSGQRIVYAFEKPSVAILKHTTPCGAAVAPTVEEALEKAWAGDPQAAYGGIVVINQPLTPQAAHFLKKKFVEAIGAADFPPESLSILSQKRTRLVQLPPPSPGWEIKSLATNFLLQQRDMDWDYPQEKENLRLAEVCVTSAFSNAAVIVRKAQLVSIAGGFVSRVEAVRYALAQAQKKGPLQDALLASDGFFPFIDSLEIIYEAGIRQLLVPMGSIRDAEIQQFAQEKGIRLFVMKRHFKHG
ncbi:MAG: hypothetical protein ACUVRD_05035 [Bacteroidia bacterium]